MWPGRSRTAVCVIRAERRDGGVLITLRMNLDIREASAESSRTVAQVDDAVAAVRDFLVEFAADRPAD